ncbi:TIGR03862 family flavoprotein [Actibacterium lipolyticum]|uniref:Ribulose-1,5-biphosphate synthetase n=1 Tax=Actibacterium lipolyticum TaxID=1524263 RepID=A0A238KUK1_9RHOB|nr:TIGR03862 family flavoprotein [Actibacterium lipolyticum]SMX46358.1 ribulose-1,5-biphosphate synthetase [Actibacterium lipolyticum]
MTDALIIGAGPAGLMAAEALADAGRQVLVVDAKPSVGRKFLMAGKSGLNLTKDEPDAKFMHAYGKDAGPLGPMIKAFGPAAVQAWAQQLGQEVFTGSSGRVFPTAMKASPLLRAWLARLSDKGVTFRTRYRLCDLTSGKAVFETPDGTSELSAPVIVLALGGASWARLGSDGAWADILSAKGVPLAPFKPANVGLKVAWSPQMARHFGAPVKGAALQADGQVVRGEFVISQRGLEGGGIYAISSAVRDGADLSIDLMPDWTVEKIAERLNRPRGKSSVSNHIRKALKLDPARQALLMEFARPLPEGMALAHLVKSLPIRHDGPRPMDEAISTAGGVQWNGLDDTLMLRDLPGVFCAGEMLDWEAPTGGYLITACLATGLWAGRAAAAYS